MEIGMAMSAAMAQLTVDLLGGTAKCLNNVVD